MQNQKYNAGHNAGQLDGPQKIDCDDAGERLVPNYVTHMASAMPQTDPWQ